MYYSIEAIRSDMFQMLDNVYPVLDILGNGRYSVDDILDQVIMEYIIKDYQQNAPRKSVRQHRDEHGMTNQIDDAATAQRYNRIIRKANHYKQFNAQQLQQTAGVIHVDATQNDLNGPSNWQNAYTYTDINFHELTMQDRCPLLKKIFEHKIPSAKSVPNPDFIAMFESYSKEVDALQQSMDMDKPDSIISKTVELFILQWKYHVELFYGLTMEAEKHGFPKQIPYKRMAALCCLVPSIPPAPWFPMEIRAAENRMLMKRDLYISDIFSLNDDDWAFQMDIIGETLRLKEILGQAQGGTAFLPFIHQLSALDKAMFIREKYWLWSKRPVFDWSNRKRIQYMRDLYDNLTVKIPKPSAKNS